MVKLMDDDFPHDYHCYSGAHSTDPSQTIDKGGRGITVWGPLATPNDDIYLAPSGGPSSTWTGYFTCTKPRCYTSGDFCNLTFTIHTQQTATTKDFVGPIVFTLSGHHQDIPSQRSHSTYRYHSKVGGHDLTETHDLAQSVDDYDNTLKVLNDTGLNSITFTNNDPQVGVWIQRLQIVRAYGMSNLENQGSCSPDQTSPEWPDFALRQDYPCNYEKCGGLSYTGFNGDDHDYTGGDGIILLPENESPGNPHIYSWSWTNPPATFNGYNTYDGSSHCIFNFNNVCLCDDNGVKIDDPSNPDFPYPAPSTDEIPFLLSLDSYHWYTFYHCKTNYHMAHSVDLATYPGLSQYYNDSPDGSNTLYLKIPDPNPGVNLFLVDGGRGIVNLYRVYKTKPCCPTITSGPVGSGTISPWGGPFPVPEQGKTFDMSANDGYYLSDVKIDGASKGSMYPYTVKWSDLDLANRGMEGHDITAYFNADHSDHSDTCASPDLPLMYGVSGVAVIPPSVTFVIDGDSYSSEGTICLSPGNHAFSVDQTTSDVYGNYTFAYFDVLDGGANHKYYVYENPATINVDAATGFVIATYTRDP